MKTRRKSKQREMVLEAVRSRCDHPSANDIYLDVCSRSPRISRGTVYRNLNYLADAGEIRPVQAPGADRFDRRREPHYHLRCTGCGKVSDVSIPYRKEIDTTLSEESGYQNIQHAAMFEGVCPDCLGAAARES